MLIKTYYIMFRLIQIINFIYRIFRMRMGDVKYEYEQISEIYINEQRRRGLIF